MAEIIQLPYDKKAILSNDKNELAKYLFSLVAQLKKELKTKTDNEADSVITGTHDFTSIIKLGSVAGTANQKIFMNALATAAEWDTGSFTNTFTRAIAGANASVSYTGVGFKPSIVFFLMSDGTASTNFSAGFDLSGSRGVLATINDAGLTITLNLYSVIYAETWNTKLQTGLITSMDADGFTMSWVRTGLTAVGAMSILYLAIR